MVCIDSTAGKIYFFAHILHHLHSRYDHIILIADQERCGDFLSHFPKLDVRQDCQPQPGELVIELTVTPKAVSYPADQPYLQIPLYALRDMETDSVNSRLARKFQIPPIVSDNYALSYITGIIDDLINYFHKEHDYKGRRIMITAGPTAEDIDPVRFITNHSSGKMGIALARAAFIRGAEVKLICGPTELNIPSYLDCVRVRSAKQMAEAVFAEFPLTEIYIGAAAVADFTPQVRSENKIKKSVNELQMILCRTTDILKSLAERKSAGQLLIGFSLETENAIANSQKKLLEKKLDTIIVNNPGVPGAAFSADTNVVSIIGPDQQVENFPMMSKFELANIILDKILILK